MTLQAVDLPLAGLKLLRPRVFRDDRGYFLETYQRSKLAAAGVAEAFVQDNVSFSHRGIVRGLHYQYPSWQGKLVTVLQGSVYDVVVDVRAESPTFGRWHAETLRDDEHAQLWVPPGFAHGFCVTSETALVHYKCTTFYDAPNERTLRFDDPALGIPWPVKAPVLSPKDAAGRSLDAILREGP